MKMQKSQATSDRGNRSLSAPMVAYISRNLDGRSGADLNGHEAIGAMRKAGANVFAVTEKGQAGLLGGMNAMAEVAVFRSPRRSRPRGTEAASLRAYAGWAKRLIQAHHASSGFRRLEPEVAVVNDLGSHELWSRMESWRVKRSALVVQEAPSFYTQCFDPTRTIDWACHVMDQYTDLIFVSKSCQHQWSRYLPVGRRSRFCIPNCCREADALSLLSQSKAAVRVRLGFSQETVVGTCAGSIQPRKGQDVLIESLEGLCESVPRLRLCIVGPLFEPFVAWGEALKARVAESRHSDRVTFFGYRPDVMDIVYASDFIILPSRSEALPLALLEAMCLKTAIVASQVGGVGDLVEDGVSGLLFGPDDIGALIERAGLIADPQRRKRLADAASSRYWSEFSRARFYERYKGFLQATSRG
ncbi:MAG: glycosyltransferase family 4 protein [Acidobacteriales bacterium]|nr:glycosyltransferase family 4 protein [Terriglobales bacterium]